MAQEIKGCEDISLATKGASTAFEPLCSHVYHTERVQVFTACGITAVSDKIDFSEAWASIVPISKGTHRDLVFEYRAGPSCGPATVLETAASWLELAINRRRVHAEQQLDNLGLKRQIASAFQGCDPQGQESVDAFATQMARLFPDVCQSLHDYNTIWRVASARSTRRFGRTVFEQVNGVLAMVTRGQDKLIQDSSFLCLVSA